MSLMLHGSESDVKSALEKYSASKLAITAVTTLKHSIDKFSQEEKNGYKTLVVILSFFSCLFFPQLKITNGFKIFKLYVQSVCKKHYGRDQKSNSPLYIQILMHNLSIYTVCL